MLRASTFVAETASIFNEALLHDQLLASADEPELRIALLQYRIDTIAMAFYEIALLLEKLAGRLASSGSEPFPGANCIIVGAAKLGDPRFDIPKSFRQPVATGLEASSAAGLRSKPIGFYTWSDDLRTVFRQDRMLQTELEGQEGIEQIVHALRAAPQLRVDYEAYLNLVARLTNPLAYPVTAEVYVDKILNRDQFRWHCDRYRTQSAILKNLE